MPSILAPIVPTASTALSTCPSQLQELALDQVRHKKRRPSSEDRRSICSSCSRLPRDHPTYQTPVTEGTFFTSGCLYHKPPATAADWTSSSRPYAASMRIRPALRSRAVRALVHGIIVSARASRVNQTLAHRLTGIATMPVARPAPSLTDSEGRPDCFGIMGDVTSYVS